LVPTATEFVPFAAAFTPQPNDEAAADAPLLLAVTELTTGMDDVVASVRMCAVETLRPLTNRPLVGVRAVTAGADVVVTLVPAVKNRLVGAITFVSLVRKLDC
jgi:hypothetical protein